MIQERQKLDEQHERERLERERQLAIAREAKRHYKPPTEPAAAPTVTASDESPPSPIDEIQQSIPYPDQTAINSRPLYDRTTKPRNERVTAEEATVRQRVRDFSPVIGQNVVSGSLRPINRFVQINTSDLPRHVLWSWVA